MGSDLRPAAGQPMAKRHVPQRAAHQCEMDRDVKRPYDTRKHLSDCPPRGTQRTRDAETPRQTKRSEAFRLPTWCFMVAGGGFEPPTFGL